MSQLNSKYNEEYQILFERKRTSLGIPDHFNIQLLIYARCRVVEFNKLIKTLAKRAGINSIKFLIKNNREKVIEVNKPKDEMISPHTCRIIFCILKLLKGMPATKIMKFRGIK